MLIFEKAQEDACAHIDIFVVRLTVCFLEFRTSRDGTKCSVAGRCAMQNLQADFVI
jgi:hypothetical protein